MGQANRKASSDSLRPPRLERAHSSLKASEKAEMLEKRGKIVKEIEATEQTYVASLHLCMQFYLQPLHSIPPDKKPIIHSKYVDVIFGALPDIFEVHMAVLEDLKNAIAVASDPSKANVAAVFLNHKESFKSYTTYINNYNHAMNTLDKCQRKSAFTEFLHNVSTEKEGEVSLLNLPSYLIMPIQRLPRYVLLLSDLVKNTPKSHSDYKAGLEALDDIREVADYVNEEKRIAENMQQILEIQSTIAGISKSLLSRRRCFVREGDLSIEATKNKAGVKTLHYFLFNDMLLLCHEGSSLTLSNIFSRQKKRKMWTVVYESSVFQIDVQALKDRHDRKNAASIVLKRQELVAHFDTSESKAEWIELFQQTRASAPALQQDSLRSSGTTFGTMKKLFHR